MKLTKEIIEVLKYHGYTTITVPTEDILKVYDTVEDFGYAGYIGDRGAIDFLKTIFDDDGINRSAEVGEEELEKQSEITPEPITPEPISNDDVITIDEGPEFDGAGFTDADNEPPVAPEPIEKPKPKKTITTKKTTKKES